MPTYYGVTTHRIAYKALSFATGKTVTAYIWNPSLAKSELQTLTEISDGLYYLDYAFPAVGTYIGIFYENSVATVMGTFKITTFAGAGAITWAYTLTDEDTGLPIADATIWITTDIGGANIIASGLTNANGVATFYLDVGTVYVWRQKSGYDFDNPDQETVAP